MGWRSRNVLRGQRSGYRGAPSFHSAGMRLTSVRGGGGLPATGMHAKQAAGAVIRCLEARLIIRFR